MEVKRQLFCDDEGGNLKTTPTHWRAELKNTKKSPWRCSIAELANPRVTVPHYSMIWYEELTYSLRWFELGFFRSLQPKICCLLHLLLLCVWNRVAVFPVTLYHHLSFKPLPLLVNFKVIHGDTSKHKKQLKISLNMFTGTLGKLLNELIKIFSSRPIDFDR